MADSRISIVKPDDQEKQNWNVRKIDWRFVFGQLPYGILLYTLVPCVVLGLVLWAFDEEPELDVDVARVLENRDYDAPKKATTIPAFVAVLLPLFIFLLQLFLCEFWIFKRHHPNITSAAYVVFYFFTNWFCAFAVHIFCQQISAIVVAEPRPDYGDRCRLVDGRCSRKTDDGLRSFFSGHASSAVLSAAYASIYLLWAVYIRASENTGSLPMDSVRKTWRQRTVHEFLHASVLYLIVVQLGFAWIVGVSRITDNRHHVWDVTAGLLVGIVVASFFSVHAILALHSMPKKANE